MVAPAQKPPRDRRRDAIIEVARELFFEEGYAAASMSSIAARLGGSKGTLYNYFRSKEELFEAQVRKDCERIAHDAFDMLQSAESPIEDVLTELGVRYLTHIFSDWAIRTYRVVVAEAIRSPQLARIFYENGPAVGLRRLEAYLEDARAKGTIKLDDCAMGAGEFLTLCRGHQHFMYTLNLEFAPNPDQMRTQARHAVALFLRSYGEYTL
ncbi:MAG TPA: TetR/AcrR family transcriptional regulator [Caulobacteraceae bacterium]|jgi:AcrR family transcriptional regulator|nr:TetR/AcrR family transcriptional regulator [Caulobacteraceae bacterium]